MELSIERARVSDRMKDVRTLLSFIKTQESDAVPPVDSDTVKILRGLFFVHLYGAFEKSVNEAVEQYLQEISTLKLKVSDFACGFLPIALEPRFASLQSTAKWQSRIDFSNALESEEACVINNAVLASQLQNTWSHTLTAVASYIGVPGVYKPNGRDSHYLDEVVEKRNQVAHGRNPPVLVGSTGRSADLELRFEALNRLLEGFFHMLESHFNDLKFLRQNVRAEYQKIPNAD
jgi:hypothetical protein